MQTGPNAPAQGLEHASRRVGEARPFGLPAAAQRTRWSCTRCQRSFPLGESWAVDVRGRDRTLQFVVCPRCAVSFALPPAMLVDLEQLRGTGLTATVLQSFREHVEAIAAARGDDDAERVAIRATDLRVFAYRHGVSAPAFARFLEAEGIATPM